MSQRVPYPPKKPSAVSDPSPFDDMLKHPEGMRLLGETVVAFNKLQDAEHDWAVKAWDFLLHGKKS